MQTLNRNKQAELYLPKHISNLRYRAPETKNRNLMYISLNHPRVTVLINSVYTCVKNKQAK